MQRTATEPQLPMMGARSIWAAVLYQAVLDLAPSAMTPAGARAQAADWFCDESDAVGSLEYVCAVLGMDADAIRDQLTRRMLAGVLS